MGTFGYNPGRLAPMASPSLQLSTVVSVNQHEPVTRLAGLEVGKSLVDVVKVVLLNVG